MGKTLALLIVIAAGSCLPPGTRALSGQQRARVAYDSVHDKTVLHLERMTLDSGAEISVVGTFNGRSMVRPEYDMLILTMWLTAGRPVSSENGIISIALDGDALAWRGRAYSGAAPSSGEFEQVLMAAVPVGDWRRLVHAKDPVLTVGTQRFAISESVREAVRQYLALFEAEHHPEQDDQ